jgi:hypothetical protein
MAVISGLEYEYQNIKERRKKKPSLKKAFGTTIIS